METPTTQIYTLSLHDALPISMDHIWELAELLQERDMIYVKSVLAGVAALVVASVLYIYIDRKSTRLNSSHVAISYAVFCLKKKIMNVLFLLLPLLILFTPSFI